MGLNVGLPVTRCVASLIATAFVYGCAEEPLSGRIITGAGQHILSLSLADGRVEPIFYDPSVIVHDVSRIDAHRLLVSIQSLRQFSEHMIMIHDLQRGTWEEYAEGHRAVYLPTHEKVLVNDHPRLYMADLDRDANDERVLIDEQQVSSFSVFKPVAVSDDEFLFRSGRDGAPGIWKYHIPTRSSVRLEQLDDCTIGAIWVPGRGQLLCTPNSGVDYWIGLDGSGRVEAGFLSYNGEDRIVTPKGYVPELDGIIYLYRTFSFFRMEEIYPVWLFELSTRRHRKIADNLGAFGIAYFE